jgi:type II secretory pathway pseudopilin PulG
MKELKRVWFKVHKNAFLLIELLVSIALFSVLVLTISSLQNLSIKTKAQAKKRMEALNLKIEEMERVKTNA